MSSGLAGRRPTAAGRPSLRFTLVLRCPTCGSGDSAAWSSAEDLLHDVHGTFDYRRCRGCRTVYQSPRVSDDSLADCYPDDYFTHDVSRETPPDARVGDDGPGWRSAVRAQVLGSLARRPGRSRASVALGRVLAAVPAVRDRAAFGMIAELVPAGGADRCLEIGPGTGADMARLRRLGWAVVEGLDIDAEAAGQAAARSGCPVHVGHLGAFEAARRFDLIYGSHSFEHLPSVRGSILAMRALLGPSGRLVLVLPNVDSLTTRCDRSHAVTVDAPRHLVLPPARALRRALEDAGFVVERVRTTARSTAHYRAIARGRRRGARGPEAWHEPQCRSDRVAQGVVRGLCALRLPLGEELVVVARKAG